jgi:AraC-like DNA-binding protein
MLYPREKDFTSFYYALAKEEMQKPDFTRTEMKGFILFGEACLYTEMDDAHLYDFYTVSPFHADSLRTSIRLHEEAGLYFDNPLNFCSAALSQAILGNIARSHELEQKAFDAAGKSPENFSTVYYISALIRYREKKFFEAIALASKGLELSLANGKNSDGVKNVKVLYQASMAIGDYRNACKYLKQADEIQEEILGQEKQHQLILSQIKYDTKLKEEQLQKEREHNRTVHIYIRFISGGLALLLVVLVVYIILYRQKQKAYRLLVQQSLQWAETRFTRDDATIPPNEEEPDADENLSPIDIEEQYLLMQKVYELFENEKLYKHKDLSLKMLAHHVRTNPAYLSPAVNHIAHTNFKSFINQYRIKEAIMQIKEMLSSDQTFDMIADDCGFGDRSTFYRSFKKETNVTPLKFKQNISKDFLKKTENQHSGSGKR